MSSILSVPANFGVTMLLRLGLDAELHIFRKTDMHADPGIFISYFMMYFIV